MDWPEDFARLAGLPRGRDHASAFSIVVARSRSLGAASPRRTAAFRDRETASGRDRDRRADGIARRFHAWPAGTRAQAGSDHLEAESAGRFDLCGISAPMEFWVRLCGCHHRVGELSTLAGEEHRHPGATAVSRISAGQNFRAAGRFSARMGCAGGSGHSTIHCRSRGLGNAYFVLGLPAFFLGRHRLEPSRPAAALPDML